MTRGVFTSEFWWCVVIAIASLFFVTAGNVTWDQWVDLIKWLSVTYVGAAAVKKVSFYNKNGTTEINGQGGLFRH